MSTRSKSKFPDIADKKVKELREQDDAVSSIQSRDGPITFNWLRESFKRDHDLKDSLDYGKAILRDVSQLDQYLYTYGKMIQSQWERLLNGTKTNSNPIRVVDYGCGQGLAALAISDHLGSAFRKKVQEVHLIEPSQFALVRAEAVYRNLFPGADITCQAKKLDDLKSEEFSSSGLRTLHLFSNILDIPTFDISHVFNSTLTNGDHTILAVSHNRDFAGGAGRLRSIKKELEKPTYAGWMQVSNSTLTEFSCGGGGKFPAIGWSADLVIARG